MASQPSGRWACSFDEDSIVPYTLDDIRLFVSLDVGYRGNNQTSLTSFNPFTGVMERLIGDSLTRALGISRCVKTVS